VGTTGMTVALFVLAAVFTTGGFWAGAGADRHWVAGALYRVLWIQPGSNRVGILASKVFPLPARGRGIAADFDRGMEL